MNIAQAKTIPLAPLVEALGGRYAHRRNGEAWYFSPFRPQERTASFKVNEKTNTWHDFGLGGGQGGSKAGGDVIDLWCDLHLLDRRSGVKDALRGLQALSPPSAFAQQRRDITAPRPVLKEATSPAREYSNRFEIIKLHPRIFYPSLLQEVRRRRIPLDLASQYLQQAFIRDTKNPRRKLNGFAFRNCKGGYEISIPNPERGQSFKTCIGPKTYTFVQGQNAERLEIFEGFWDFLARLAMEKLVEPPYDTYVLNAVSIVGDAVRDIKEYANNVLFISVYMDTDMAGERATDFLVNSLCYNDVTVESQGQLYYPRKDLSEWWANYPKNR